VLLKMPILACIARQQLPHAPLTKDGNEHTYTGPSLPDLYLQSTCKLAVKSPLVRGPSARRLPCSSRPCSSSVRSCLRNAERSWFLRLTLPWPWSQTPIRWCQS